MCDTLYDSILTLHYIYMRSMMWHSYSLDSYFMSSVSVVKQSVASLSIITRLQNNFLLFSIHTTLPRAR